MEYIWIADCADIFGGYGIFAVGRTKDEAERLLYERYKEESPEWNGTDEYHLKSFKDLNDEWGVHIRKCSIGKSYFGDGEIH